MERSGISVAAVVSIVLVAAILFSIVALYNFSQQKNAVADLSISVGSFVATANGETMIPTVITNTGGQANQIVVTLTSQAFGSVQLQPTAVGPNKYVTVDSSVSIGDIQPGSYQLSIQYTYQDSNGTHALNGSTGSFTVVPSVKITGFIWETTGIIFTSAKSTIGANDNTQVSFKVISNSQSQTYSGLTASIQMIIQSQGLSITPNVQQLSPIGPQGTSPSYSFTLATHNTPPGKYSLSISVSYGNDIGVATYSFQLTVS